MTTQFEFHLQGANAPEGQLDADLLIAIVQSLKSIALNIGRIETDAERLGRAPARVHRVARLVIGMEPGSTTILARRAGAGANALDFDLADEEAFDAKFESLMGSIALDQRPDWVDDSLAAVMGQLTAALQQAATAIEFKANGQTRRRFATAGLQRETWNSAVQTPPGDITFVGRLYAVNLHTHRLLVQDDVGHQVALPNVADDSDLGPLLGRYVAVTGSPEFDPLGQVKRIQGAAISAAADPIGSPMIPEPLSLEEILASAPGIEPGRIEGLSDAEADAFFDAMGL
ncbi:hypothetical protein [Gordonia rhizosphera]|uniref:Uncharacterized protein n=1 Tax=Gordonia rhizosphera NBRC 16068 TaxID=1108045 RepID=K6WFF1_9ACTN|nr:hypothetical protein [Gordonia rhizosphera]GAB92491.1 hypothetical protein GORHZ_181_00080 [Gordonia rhizosphera NBRC 16068]